MLESLQQTNIGSLNLEEPVRQNEPPFDPSIEITDTDWDWIESDLRHFASTKDFLKFLSVGSVMRVLNPERASKFKEFDKLWPVVQDNFGFSASQLVSNIRITGEGYIKSAAELKTLYPERFEKSSRYMDYLEETSTRIQAYQGADGLLNYDYKNRRLAASVKIILPEVNFTQEPILAQLKKFEDYPQGVNLLYAWAGYLRILAPGDYRMDFKNDVWKGLKIFLPGFREKHDSDMFLGIAFQLAMLAATNVDISNGLKITIPKQDTRAGFNISTPALPEVRKF